MHRLNNWLCVLWICLTGNEDSLSISCKGSLNRSLSSIFFFFFFGCFTWRSIYSWILKLLVLELWVILEGPLKFTCLFTDPIYFLFNKQIVLTWRHGGHICVQNNEPAAMFVYKKNPVGIELFSHVKTFFYFMQFAELLTTWLKTMYRFHVAVRLFINRSQMTSKCSRNKEVAHEPQASASLMFLPHFDVFCEVLRNLPMPTWNLFVL